MKTFRKAMSLALAVLFAFTLIVTSPEIAHAALVGEECWVVSEDVGCPYSADSAVTPGNTYFNTSVTGKNFGYLTDTYVTVTFKTRPDDGPYRREGTMSQGGASVEVEEGLMFTVATPPDASEGPQ